MNKFKVNDYVVNPKTHRIKKITNIVDDCYEAFLVNSPDIYRLSKIRKFKIDKFDNCNQVIFRWSYGYLNILDRVIYEVGGSYCVGTYGFTPTVNKILPYNLETKQLLDNKNIELNFYE